LHHAHVRGVMTVTTATTAQNTTPMVTPGVRQGG
jgi:hypothetical protein